MFEINYRIIMGQENWAIMDLKQLELKNNVEGFFELNFKNKSYGYYHDHELRVGERGLDLIIDWFENLIEVFITLQEYNYVLLSDIDSYNTWIEFEQFSVQELSVSIVIYPDKTGKGCVITKPFDDYEYGDWKKVVINKYEFKAEIIRQVHNFIDNLKNINPNFLETNRIKSIISKIEVI